MLRDAATAAEPGVPHFVVEPPRAYNTQYRRLEDELNVRNRCAFCNEDFFNSDLGSLACSFHPMAYYARYSRAMAYSKLEAHGFCSVCTKLEVLPELHAPLTECELETRRHCTRIDHTTNPACLFDAMLVALPTFFAEKLSVFYRTTGNPSGLRNILLVDRPELITQTVVYVVPGVGQFARSVREMYDSMAAKFRLRVLDEALREAARQFKRTVTQSERAGFGCEEAVRKQSLYSEFNNEVAFVPFYIIARVEQKAGQMKFQ